MTGVTGLDDDGVKSGDVLWALEPPDARSGVAGTEASKKKVSSGDIELTATMRSLLFLESQRDSEIG